MEKGPGRIILVVRSSIDRHLKVCVWKVNDAWFRDMVATRVAKIANDGTSVV